MRSFLTVVDSSSAESFDLTTLAIAKAELGITSTSEDDLIEARITRSSKLIADFCNRVFALQSVVETFHIPFGGMRPCEQPLPLARYPVVNLETVEAEGSEVASSDYEFDADTGLLWRANGRNWCGKVVVTYSGGYDLPSDSPAALERACLELIRDMRLQRDSSIREVEYEGRRVVFASSSQTDQQLPLSIQSLIEPYRRISV